MLSHNMPVGFFFFFTSLLILRAFREALGLAQGWASSLAPCHKICSELQTQNNTARASLSGLPLEEFLESSWLSPSTTSCGYTWGAEVGSGSLQIPSAGTSMYPLSAFQFPELSRGA